MHDIIHSICVGLDPRLHCLCVCLSGLPLLLPTGFHTVCSFLYQGICRTIALAYYYLGCYYRLRVYCLLLCYLLLRPSPAYCYITFQLIVFSARLLSCVIVCAWVPPASDVGWLTTLHCLLFSSHLHILGVWSGLVLLFVLLQGFQPA